jgi:cold shock CspA family protein
MRLIVGGIEQAFPSPGLQDLMSERSFREPRRRGFNEDVFAPRQARGFGAPAPRHQPPAGPPTRATVKWFSPEKGFGFVVLDGGRGDAFLHASVLEQSGHEGANLQPGVTLKVRVGQGQKGPQVDEVLEIDESTAIPAAKLALGKRPSDRANDRRPNRMTAPSSGTVRKSGLGLSPWRAAATRCSFTAPRYTVPASPNWPKVSASRWRSLKAEKVWRR